MKRSKILFSALKVPFDYMFVVGAFMLAYFTRLQTDYDYIWNFNEFLKFTLVMAPIWILFFALQKLYIPSEKGHTFEEVSRIIIGSLAATLISISYIFLSRTDFFSRLMDENGPDPFYNDDLIQECWDRIVTELAIEMERGFE